MFNYERWQPDAGTQTKRNFVQENLTMPLSHLYNVQEFITDRFFLKFIIVLTLSAVVITPAPWWSLLQVLSRIFGLFAQSFAIGYKIFEVGYNSSWLNTDFLHFVIRIYII